MGDSNVVVEGKFPSTRKAHVSHLGEKTTSLSFALLENLVFSLWKMVFRVSVCRTQHELSRNFSSKNTHFIAFKTFSIKVFQYNITNMSSYKINNKFLICWFCFDQNIANFKDSFWSVASTRSTTSGNFIWNLTKEFSRILLCSDEIMTIVFHISKLHIKWCTKLDQNISWVSKFFIRSLNVGNAFQGWSEESKCKV